MKTQSELAEKLEEKIVQINRVSKKTKGGNKRGFSALVVVGDGKGKVGVGLGKASDVRSAIRKGSARAKKGLVGIPLEGTTIPDAITVKRGAAKIYLRPAPEGSGLVAGGPVRIVAELAGIRNLSAKILGTKNKASNVYATFEALRRLKAVKF